MQHKHRRTNGFPARTGGSYDVEPMEQRMLLSTAATNRVVGYYPDYRYSFLNGKVDWDAVTHVNYFGITPTTTGALPATSSGGYSFSQLDNVVSAAHARGRTVSIVIDPGAPFMTIAKNATARANFVANIVAFCSARAVDGVDLDWEPAWPGPPQADKDAYGTLINALHTAAPGLIISAAVNPVFYPVPLSAVPSMDWINVMGYDFDFANHSPYASSVNALVGWNNYGVPKSKLLLGMPFYGRAGTSWGNSVSKTYSDIVNRYIVVNGSAPSPSVDSAALSFPDAFGGASMTWYFNGPTTIQNKTQYVLDNGYAGVMTWELGQDHFTGSLADQYSLLPSYKSMVMVPPFASLSAGAITVTADNNANTLALGVRGANVVITLGGHTMSYPLSSVNSIVVNSLGGNDTLDITASINKPITFNGGAGSDTLNVNAGTIVFNADAQGGTSDLTLNVAAGASAVFNASQHLAALNLNGGIATLASNGNRMLVTRSLNITGVGKLDLADNAMVLDYPSTSPLAAVRSYLDSGRNGGAWNGNGISSSAAASAPGTAIGYGEAVSLFSSFPASFLGQAIDASSILARYTIDGDANLSRTVDSIDFNLLAANFGAAATTFAQGNFNFDNASDTIDFNLLASKFGGSIPSEPANLLHGPGVFSHKEIIAPESLAGELI